MMTLSAISLTTPLMLGGIVFVGGPIIAHLLNRKTRQQITFPSIALLQAVSSNQSKLFKVRRWLLLLLRVLAVCLIVFAFARPIMHDSAVVASGGGEGLATVVIVDHSASTQRMIQGIPLYQRIKAAGVRVLRGMNSGTDKAMVLMAGVKPTPLHESFSGNLSEMSRLLGDTRASFERSNIEAALAEAGEQLKQVKGTYRVVIISDMQASQWKDISLKQLVRRTLPQGTQVNLIPVTEAPDVNIGLAGARSKPVNPIVNRLSYLSAKVENPTATRQRVSVDLIIDGRKAGSETVTMLPKSTHEVQFEAQFDSPGEHEVIYSISDDSQLADNTYYQVVSVVDQVPILIISDEDERSPASELYYLKRILAPLGEGLDDFAVEVVKSNGVSGEDLDKAECVILGQVSGVDTDLAALLVGYVNKGGGLLISGGSSNWQKLNEELNRFAEDRTFLPFQIGTWQIVPDDQVLTISRGDWRAPLMSAFDERAQLGLGQIPFYRYWSVSDLTPGARGLLFFSNQTPALGIRAYGKGTVVMTTFGFSTGSSELPRFGAIVALLHSLVEGLRPADIAPVLYEPGKTLIFSLAQRNRSEAYFLTDQTGQRQLTQTLVEPDGLKIVADEIRLPGIYALKQGDKNIKKVEVNVHPSEIDLNPLEGAAIARMTQNTEDGNDTGGITVTAESEADHSMKGEEFWEWLIFLALALLGLEMFLVGVWRR